MNGAILAFDSSTGVGSAAVGVSGELLAEAVFNLGTGHSAALLPAIDYVMRTAGLAPADLAGVVVGGGPGSFTGLRIGAATAKGIVHARRLPLWAYSGLLVAAAGIMHPGPVCALFDARRRDVYAGCYRIGTREPGVVRSSQASGMGKSGLGITTQGDRGAIEVLMPPVALALEDVIERFRGEGEGLRFTGEGALLHREELERNLGAEVAPLHLSIPRASALLWLQSAAPELGRVADPVAWEPQYVRASGAERIAAARANADGISAT